MIGGRGASAKDPVIAVLRQWAAAEQSRAFLFVPPLMILGIILFFSLPSDPPVWLPWIMVSGAVAVWLGARRSLSAVINGSATVLLVFSIGFTAAHVRTQTVAAPILQHETGPLRIEGTLLRIEQRPDSQRLLIAPSKMGAILGEDIPARIRLTWRGSPSTAMPGDIVSLRGVVSPPPVPTMPGGYDYARQLYFERIGAVGFAVSRPAPVWRSENRPWSARIEQGRRNIAARIIDKASSEARPVLAAVVTGLRDQIPQSTTDQLRDTGLAHLLAISGLHMGLVCGFLFVGSRMILVALPGVAERVPAKKWAALVALVGGIIYLGLSGGAWSAQRAFIMAAISFFAMLVDRRAISLRNVAIAALVIILWRPEAVLSAGFQMSFGAVTALVAAYEAWEAWRRKRAYAPQWAPVRFLGGVFFTSFVAGLATSPFAIYHFGRIANYGLLANMAVMPLFSIGVMPIAVMGLLAMPFGLDGPFWWVSSHAFDLLMWVTARIAAWPGAVMLVPQWPVASFVVLVVGLLWICLLSAPWRLVGLAAVPGALLLAATAPAPVLMVGDAARNVAWFDQDTHVVRLLTTRRERFAAETWLEAYGEVPNVKDTPTFGPCDDVACEISTSLGSIFVASSPEAGIAACARASLLVVTAWSDGKVDRKCRVPTVTEESIAQTGPVAVYANRKGWAIDTVRARRGDRPWSPVSDH